MKRISDSTLIMEEAGRLGITDIVSGCDAVMVCRYERGEIIISPVNPLDDILFITNGTAAIYGIRPDGSSFPISTINAPEVIGDIEVLTAAATSFFVEARNQVSVISLPLSYCREKLWNDPRFLHTLLDSLSSKLTRIAFTEGVSATVEERVLNYLRDFCDDGSLKGINNATYMLRCSRRQLQRVLRKLCDEGRLQKDGKGRYRLP